MASTIKPKRVAWHFFNESALRKHLLSRVREVSPGAGEKFNRVSEQAIQDLDYVFRKAIDGYLRQQRIGKTITTP
jgi:hypothetical protein